MADALGMIECRSFAATVEAAKVRILADAGRSSRTAAGAGDFDWSVDADIGIGSDGAGSVSSARGA